MCLFQYSSEVSYQCNLRVHHLADLRNNTCYWLFCRVGYHLNIHLYYIGECQRISYQLAYYLLASSSCLFLLNNPPIMIFVTIYSFVKDGSSVSNGRKDLCQSVWNKNWIIYLKKKIIKISYKIFDYILRMSIRFYYLLIIC